MTVALLNEQMLPLLLLIFSFLFTKVQAYRKSTKPRQGGRKRTQTAQRPTMRTASTIQKASSDQTVKPLRGKVPAYQPRRTTLKKSRYADRNITLEVENLDGPVKHKINLGNPRQGMIWDVIWHKPEH